MAGVLGLLIALLLTATPIFHAVGVHVVTPIHEGGHALFCSAGGGRVDGIRVDRNGTGLTRMSNVPGSGVLTSLAGYLTPPAVGLGGLALAHTQRSAAALVIMLVALALVLVMIRNVFGLVAVVGLGALVYAVVHDGGTDTQALLASALAWTLLFGSVRLTVSGMSGGTGDAHDLAKATHVPWVLWQTLFAGAACAAAAYASWLALYRW